MAKDKFKKPGILNKMIYRVVSGKKLKTPKSSLDTVRTSAIEGSLRGAGLSQKDIERLRGKKKRG